MSPAEYRAMERDATEKHVLWNGEVFAMAGPSFAMAGGSLAHNRLVAALLIELGRALQSQECEALPSDMRVRVPSVDGYVYPDVTVACVPLDLERVDGLETLRNPRVVIEVLSESSEAFDRGDKFAGYRSIASLTDYVLVASTHRHVDHFTRQGDGSWVMRAYAGSDVVPIAAVGVELALDQLYERALPLATDSA